MLDDLLFFWGWKWSKKTREGQFTYKACAPYKYSIGEEGHFCEVEFTDELAQNSIAALKPVHASLSSTRDILHKRHWCPDDLFPILAVMDNMCILFVNTMAERSEARYRVFNSTGCAVFHTIENMSKLLRSTQENGTTVRGVALGKDHFCSLYPRNMQPNFAGHDAIGAFD
jgi:hypothetical protein